VNKNTLIGLGIGAAALYAGWHLYGRKWLQVMRGNAATVRQAVKSTRPTVAAQEIAKNNPAARAAGVGLERTKSSDGKALTVTEAAASMRNKGSFIDLSAAMGVNS
jgi:hypothetical protein